MGGNYVPTGNMGHEVKLIGRRRKEKSPIDESNLGTGWTTLGGKKSAGGKKNYFKNKSKALFG